MFQWQISCVNLLKVNLRTWIGGLYFVNGAFACAYIVTLLVTLPSWIIAHAFDMDEEATLCSWYSASLLLFSALCWLLQLEFLRHPVERYTAALTAFFLTVLSIDESVSFHESVSRKVQNATHTPFDSTGPVFLVGVPFFLMGIAVWRRWPWPGRPASLLFRGAAVMVGSACGFEMLANYVIPYSPMYRLEVLFEETGEMMGMTTILLGSYEHLRERIAERNGATASL
jgi:hypothetical protein